MRQLEAQLQELKVEKGITAETTKELKVGLFFNGSMSTHQRSFCLLVNLSTNTISRQLVYSYKPVYGMSVSLVLMG